MSLLLDYIVPFLVILTVLVFIHEMGHFWVARRCGVPGELGRLLGEFLERLLFAGDPKIRNYACRYDQLRNIHQQLFVSDHSLTAVSTRIDPADVPVASLDRTSIRLNSSH